MTECAGTVHVVFSPSTAGTLRKALTLLGRTERVIGLPGNLSAGPIDPPDRTLRQAWARTFLHTGSMVPNELDGDPAEIDQTWAEATAPGLGPVFWACLGLPMDHACFLAFVARMEGKSFDVIDGTHGGFGRATASGAHESAKAGTGRERTGGYGAGTKGSGQPAQAPGLVACPVKRTTLDLAPAKPRPSGYLNTTGAIFAAQAVSSPVAPLRINSETTVSPQGVDPSTPWPTWANCTSLAFPPSTEATSRPNAGGVMGSASPDRTSVGTAVPLARA